jgi:hypothetical protein
VRQTDWSFSQLIQTVSKYTSKSQSVAEEGDA